MVIHALRSCLYASFVFVYSAQPLTCHDYTATRKVRSPTLTGSNIPSKDRQGNQQGSYHHRSSIAAGTQARYLRSLGIGSFENRSACDRVPGCAYTPSHIFSYIAAHNISIPPKQWDLIESPTRHGQPLLSLLPDTLNSSSATPLSSASVHKTTSDIRRTIKGLHWLHSSTT